jgi:hypothetical protein
VRAPQIPRALDPIQYTDPEGRAWSVDLVFPGNQAMAVSPDFDPRRRGKEDALEPHLEFRGLRDAARHGLVPYADYPRQPEDLSTEELREYWSEFRRLNPGV